MPALGACVRNLPAVVDHSFYSDNLAPAHPSVLDALVAVNQGWAPSYGADRWSERAQAALLDATGTPGGRALLVFGGIGANVVAVRSTVAPYQAVIAAAGAHLNVHETGAIETVAGAKVLTVASGDGKIRPADIDAHLGGVSDAHSVQPAMVSLTNATEVGAVYDPDEVAAVCEHAHGLGLVVHVDGARLTNAAASLGCSLAALTGEAGVDLVSFGGTKAGLMGVEAVVFADADAGFAARYIRTQVGQLASKGRFLAAQVLALLEDEAWRSWAGHANAMAARLAHHLEGMDHVALAQPVRSNGVFVTLRDPHRSRLGESYELALWDPTADVVRIMCSWATTEAMVDYLAEAIAATA